MDEPHVSPTAESWLKREDETDYERRLARLKWLSERVPQTETWIFHDGLVSRMLFEEARYCYVYGQFLAVIVLGVAFLERSLAARLFGAGRRELERSHLPKLLPEAETHGWLTREECERIDALRELRNPVVHFRAPIHSSRLEWRAVSRDEAPYMVLDEDARTVVEE